MRRQPWGLYAIALAVLVVGLVAAGVPVSTLLFGAVVLACPLMMMFMMGGMRGGHGTAGRDAEQGEESGPTDEGHEPESPAGQRYSGRGWRGSR